MIGGRLKLKTTTASSGKKPHPLLLLGKRPNDYELESKPHKR
jgi:hypothetical protein